jgi:lysophospholipase L1-like esterase
MATLRITYNDKSHVQPYGTHEIQVWDTDMNELKETININADQTDENTENIIALTSGWRGVLLIADTPTEDGFYTAGESGTYTNAGGLVIDLTEGVNYINVSGTQTVFTKTVIPVDTIPTGDIAEGETLSVSGDKINDVTKLKSNLVVGKNLFDKDAATIGQFISNSGSVSINATYDSSDYIPIIEGQDYISNWLMRFTCYYDSDKNVVSGGTNSGVTSFTPPVGASFIIVSIAHTGLDSFQLEKGIATTDFESYKLTIVTDENEPLKSKIVFDEGVTSDETDFAERNYYLLNLFDFDNATITTGFFVNYANGNYVANVLYDATGKIELPSDITKLTLSFLHNIAFYNSSGVYISGVQAFGPGSGTVDVPVNAKYVDCTVLTDTADIFYIVVGETIGVYQPYTVPFYNKMTNAIVFQSEIVTEAEVFESVWLPKEICIAVDRQVEIYNSQVVWVGNIDNYHFVWSGIGHSMGRKWYLLGESGDVGNHTLTLKIYNNENILLATKTTTVKVVANTVTSPFTVAGIGDSLSNNKPWAGEIVSLSGGDITFVGTRQSLSGEGRSGASAAYYLGNNSYTFDATGISGIDGRTQDLNPFFNPVLGDVDYQYYKDNYTSPNPDVLIIWLGTNGLEIDPTTNAGNIKTFVDKIRATGGATIKIFIVHTLFNSNQDGMGIIGTSGVYKLNQDLKVFNLQVELYDLLESYSDLYLVPVSTCHDSEYNYGQVVTTVNPRASQTELIPSDYVHPQTQGYLQIADIIYSSLIANQ